MSKDLKIFTNNVEAEAVEQINLLLEQEPFKDCKVRIMPDVHAGKGCVIGFTADLGDKVIPNIVGVDIGCGMLCVELGKIDLDLEKLDEVINEFIPSGMNVHKKEKYNFDKLEELCCYKVLKNKDNYLNRSMGTLGGGNHFIEIDEDDEGNKYLVIHTGSRNLGKQVAELYQNEAIRQHSYFNEIQAEKQLMINMLQLQNREQEIEQKLKEIENKYNGKTKMPRDLCYLEGEIREAYLHDMKICQKYASLNRKYIADEILSRYFGPGLEGFVELHSFETIHNYISFEDNIVRKGAISAKKDERVLIPINMRDGSIIAVGKGNEDWNCSAPHGAGRIMSRTKAKQTFQLDEFVKSMKDVYSTSVLEETIDEAPFVYKPMQEIIDNIHDTVEIEKIIRPIYNFKAKN